VDRAHLLVGHRLVGERVGGAGLAEQQVLGLGGELEAVGELGLERGQGVMGLGHRSLNRQRHGCIPQPM
jgi:hypothetical protein